MPVNFQVDRKLESLIHLLFQEILKQFLASFSHDVFDHIRTNNLLRYIHSFELCSKTQEKQLNKAEKRVFRAKLVMWQISCASWRRDLPYFHAEPFNLFSHKERITKSSRRPDDIIRVYNV